MLVSRIKNIGNFENIELNGIVNPIYNCNNIGLTDGDSLNEILTVTNQNKKVSLAKLKINLVGKSDNDKETIGFTIAYTDIIILKGNYILSGIELNFNKDDAIVEICDSTDEINLCLFGIDIAKHNKSLCRSVDNVNIVGIHKVYVDENFRRLGISNWIHNNIRELIESFSMINPDIITLSYGDFANEAKDKFKLDSKSYCQFLHKMYKKIGYKDMTFFNKMTSCVNYSSMMYKI